VAGEVFREGKPTRFAFIHSERDAYPISVRCRVKRVTRTGYHARAVREDCDRVREDRVISANVAAAIERSGWTYGSPRIRIDLHEDGMRVGQSRIAWIMRKDGLVARRKKASRTMPASARLIGSRRTGSTGSSPHGYLAASGSQA